MKCAWDELLRILPQWLRRETDLRSRETLQEVRLRLNKQPELVMQSGSVWLDRSVSRDDLNFCINAASRYSPWAAATSTKGYLTAPGGHRIGICGEEAAGGGCVRNITSLCIRVARDFPGAAIGEQAYPGSVLIIGKPGSGKTTLLRDLIRRRSDRGTGSIAVVDERGELFPDPGGESGFPEGRRTDVLSGFSKADGVDMALRTMGPTCIAVDEITAQADCEALIRAGWCGVTLLATAHASNREDLQRRAVYRPLLESGLFQTVFVMQPDKTWRGERMDS